MALRRGRRALVVVALAATALVLALRSERAGVAICGALRDDLPRHLGVEVDAARCHVEPLEFSVQLEDVAVKEHGTVLATAELAQVSLRSVLWSHVTLDELKLVRPHLTLAIPEGGADDGPKRCPLDALRRVKVEALLIEDGTVELRQGARQLALDGVELKWAARRSQVNVQLAVKGGRFADGERDLALGRTLLEADLDVDSASVSLSRAETGVAGATAALTGTVEQLCDPAPLLALQGQLYVPLASAAPLLGVDAQGQISARVSVSGRTSSPRARAEVQASGVTLGPARPGDFSAVLAATTDELRLESFVSKAGAGQVKLSGEMKVGGAWPVKVKVETENASFAHVMDRAGQKGVWVDFPASVSGVVTGALLPKPALTGDIDARVGHFTLAARPWDGPESAGPTILTFPQAHASFRLAVLSDRVEFHNVRVQAGLQGGTKVAGEVVLHYALDRGLSIHVDAESLQLSDFGAIAGLPMSGQGTASVDIVGPNADVDITGRLSVRDLVFAGYAPGVVQSPIAFRRGLLRFPSLVGQKGRTGFSGTAALDFRDEGLFVDAQADLPRARLEDVLALVGPLHPTLQTLQGSLVGDGVGHVEFHGPAKANDGHVTLAMKGATFYGRRLGDAALSLRLDQSQALVLDPLHFKGPLGTFSASGRWAFEGGMAFAMSLDQGDLTELLGREWAEPSGVTGPASAKLKVEGTPALPQLQGYLTSSQVTWAQHPVGPMQLELRMQGRDLEVFGTPFTGARGQLKVLAREPFPWTGRYDVAIDELKPFLPASLTQRGLSGSLKGVVQLAGNLPAVAATDVQAELSKLQLQRGDLSLANDGPVAVAWQQGKLTLGSFALAGADSRIRAQGTFGPATADLQTEANVDLRLLEAFVPGLERAGGRVALQASVSGAVDAPSVVGTASLTDGRFQLKEAGLWGKALQAKAEFSQDRVLVHDVQGFLNDGKATGRGDLMLKQFHVERAELGLDLEEVSYAPRPELPATLTGPLLFYGTPGHWQLSGTLDVTRLKYTRGFTLESLLQEVAAPRLLAPTEKAAPWLALDLELDASRGDVRVDNALARARLTGKLKVQGTNAEPVLLGSLETAEGAQGFFRDHTFQVTRGVVTFPGGQPSVELSAQTQVREYLVGVKAFGPLSELKVQLTSEPSLPESDVLALITLGVTSKEKLASQAGAGLAAEALLSATGLEREVQRFLRNNVGLKDQKVQLSTSFNEATGQAEPSVSWEAKVGTDKLTVGVTQPVTGRGTKAQAEYRFNPRVSARAQWDNQSQDSSVGNPGVDLKFRFEWE